MRTTVDIPAELMHAAKARAAQRGETLKDLVTRALARELRVPAGSARTGRVTLPLIGSAASPSANMTNVSIEAALDADDIDRYARLSGSLAAASLRVPPFCEMETALAALPLIPHRRAGQGQCG